MKNCIFLIATLLVCLGTAFPVSGEQLIIAKYVSEPPVIDGMGNDPAWKTAEQTTTIDKVGNIPVSLKAVYTDDEIFLMVSFEDRDESRSHKSWTWDKAREIYTVGYDREDVFVFKWNMMDEPVDLSIYSDHPYQADVWFWKACRTDPAGYADDKYHNLGMHQEKNATILTSKSGKETYLVRNGDNGVSAYKISLKTDFQGDSLPRYESRSPTGSRSDVRARGSWKDSAWTIEFRRSLETGNRDDIQFETGQKYLFGISRYEVAGRNANPKLSQPLYGAGDVNEVLWLEFAR